MFPVHFHAARRHRPNARVKVDLIPTRFDDFACPSCCQNAEFERGCAYGALGPKLSDEGRNVRERQCCMMTSRKLSRLRQQLIQMTLPPCGIVVFPMPLGPHCINYALDPAT